jgi:hypothetical protein
LKFLFLLSLALLASCSSDPSVAPVSAEQDPHLDSANGEPNGGVAPCLPFGARYNRDSLYGGWIDIDRDCQNTRAEILIARSARPVTFTNSSRCTVDSGEWVDPYTGKTHLKASQLQIDHIVPLADAWRSGAWTWALQERIAFENDTSFLVPVASAINSNKSDQTPDEWMPPNRAYWPAYAAAWIRAKNLYSLSARPNEAAAVLPYGAIQRQRACSI